jgi:hypothetical protein
MPKRFLFKKKKKTLTASIRVGKVFHLKPCNSLSFCHIKHWEKKKKKSKKMFSIKTNGISIYFLIAIQTSKRLIFYSFSLLIFIPFLTLKNSVLGVL